MTGEQDEGWDRRVDYGYGLEYEPLADTPASDPLEPEPVDDPIGDSTEEYYEAAYRDGHITREEFQAKVWRRYPGRS
ncbi:hypothetical protein [Streptomyces sp. NPDC093225]|uniref:hypothetical protein n=1 Tax=Streptomyces sp. NPDC093225 TaxID=3366034 RepID=UPI00380647B2